MEEAEGEREEVLRNYGFEKKTGIPVEYLNLCWYDSHIVRVMLEGHGLHIVTKASPCERKNVYALQSLQL